MSRFLRIATLAACQYEVLAIPDRSPLPTICTVCRRHRWLPWALLGGLALHLFVPAKGHE